jgi:hypothetical protein
MAVSENGLKISIIVLMFVIGKLVEKQIDRRFLEKYKRTLVLLVIDRSRNMWVAFNSKVLISRNARESLIQLESQSKLLLKAEAENPDELNFKGV